MSSITIDATIARDEQTCKSPRTTKSSPDHFNSHHGSSNRINLGDWLLQVAIVLFTTDAVETILDKLSQTLSSSDFRYHIRAEQVLAIALARAYHSTAGMNCRPTNATIAATLQAISPLWQRYFHRRIATSQRTIRLGNRVLESIGAMTLISLGHGSSHFIGKTSKTTGRSINTASVYALTYCDQSYRVNTPTVTAQLKTTLTNLVHFLDDQHLPDLLTTSTISTKKYPLISKVLKRTKLTLKNIFSLKRLITNYLIICVKSLRGSRSHTLSIQRRRYFSQQTRQHKISTKLLNAPITITQRHQLLALATKISQWPSSGALTPLDIVDILLNTPTIGPPQSPTYLLDHATPIHTIEHLAETLTHNWSQAQFRGIPYNPRWWVNHHQEKTYLQRLLMHIALRLPTNSPITTSSQSYHSKHPNSRK